MAAWDAKDFYKTGEELGKASVVLVSNGVVIIDLTKDPEPPKPKDPTPKPPTPKPPATKPPAPSDGRAEYL